MKKLTVLVLAIVSASGYLIKVPVAPVYQPAFAPSGWIHMQKLVLSLFDNICDTSNDPMIVRLAQDFTSVTATDFWEPEVFTKFETLKTGKGFLPKGQIFSDYNVEHNYELKIMFDVMRSAKSFDTFYKVAAWSRQNLNCGLYVNLIYMALENRRDTEKLTLPPPYELLPNYFIRKDIIIQGSSLLAGEEFTPSEGVRDEGNAYTLDANYTANFDDDDESKLAYFREDIGLNSYYFLKMLKWAPKMSANVNINGRYGEELYLMIKQLVARYDLERYANGMPEQDAINWDSLFDTPYDPMLVYSNGNEFIHRTSPVQLPENEDKALLQTIENNIVTVVSHMRDAGYNKTQILNHLMEILVTSERSYDTLARRVLSKALSNNGEPTVYEHYMTSLRDPMIWRVYKKIVYMVDESLKTLPPYTKSELYFPGVEVTNIEVKKMLTNFDYFEFDITEALKIGNGDTTFRVKIGQSRLNHKPFVMKLNISSLVTQKGLVKIYLGPKVMPGEFAKKKNQFNLLDSFEINLKKGSNIVSRTSSDMKMYAPDFTSLKTLSKKVEDAQFGLDSLPLNSIDSQIGFPERLTIPKGTPEGIPLQLFVFVAPLAKVSAGAAYYTTNSEFNSAVLSPLYPLDFPIEDKLLLDLPNVLLKDLVVTHKSGSVPAKSWPKSPSSKPNMYDSNNEQYDFSTKSYYYEKEQNDGSLYSSRPSQQFDYKSKRPQFQKPDYASNRVDYKALYQNKVITESEPVVKIDKLLDKELVNDNFEKVTHTVESTTTEKINADPRTDIENQMQSDDSSIKMSPYLSSSSLVDDYYYTKEKDSVLKQPKLVKPDYKKIFKNLWKMPKNPTTKTKTSKVHKNEETPKTYNDEDMLIVLPKGETVKIFKIIQDSNEANQLSKKYFIDEYRQNIDVSANSDMVSTPKNNYNKLIYKDAQTQKDGQYFGLYKDNGGDEFTKVELVTDKPTSELNKMYKYIMRYIHDDDIFDKVIEDF